MQNGSVPQKITRIHTYRDDFERAKKEQNVPSFVPETPPVTNSALPKKPTPTQEKKAKAIREELEERQKQESKALTALGTKPIPEPKNEEVKKQPTENPPFHYIRATNPGDSPLETNKIKAKAKAPLKINTDDVALVGTKKSILTTHDDVFDVSAADHARGTGSVITDTKRKRFRLFPAIFTSFKNWLNTKQKKYEDSRKPKYTINTAKERKGVIKKAGEKSAIAPSDDHTTVTARLKDLPRETTTSELSIKKADEVPTPSWSHLETKTIPEEPVEEETSETVEEFDAFNQVPFVPAQEPTPTINVPSYTAEKSPSILETPVDNTDDVLALDELDTEITEPIDIPTPEPKEEEMSLETVIHNEIIKPQPEEEDKLETPSVSTVAQNSVGVTKKARYTSPSTPNTTRSPLLLIGVSVGAMILGVTFVFVFFGKEDTIPLETNIEVHTIQISDEQVTVPLTDNRALFFNNIVTVQPRTLAEITQIHPTLDTEGKRTATTKQILTIMNLHAPGNFIRSITDIGFGMYQNNQLFIVIKTTSFDAAFSGMLEWEKTMSNDLTPLFGETVTRTFDPNARTATQTREPFFIDVINSNLDMRILQGELLKDRLGYTFLNSTTILITGTRDNISELAPLVQ